MCFLCILYYRSNSRSRRRGRLLENTRLKICFVLLLHQIRFIDNIRSNRISSYALRIAEVNHLIYYLINKDEVFANGLLGHNTTEVSYNTNKSHKNLKAIAWGYVISGCYNHEHPILLNMHKVDSIQTEHRRLFASICRLFYLTKEYFV